MSRAKRDAAVADLIEEFFGEKGSPDSYKTSHIKRRRSTKVEVEDRRRHLLEIVADM